VRPLESFLHSRPPHRCSKMRTHTQRTSQHSPSGQDLVSGFVLGCCSYPALCMKRWQMGLSSRLHAYTGW
jgi:hypothetical protein